MNQNIKELNKQYIKLMEEAQKLGKEIAYLKAQPDNEYTWEKSFDGCGFSINLDTSISIKTCCSVDKTYKNMFKSHREVTSAFAMAQLSYVKAKANADWVADWTCADAKYTITRRGNSVNTGTHLYDAQFLSFKTRDIMVMVLEQNERLIKDYLMID